MKVMLTNEKIVKEMSDLELAEMMHALDMGMRDLEAKEQAYENLLQLKDLCDHGRADVASIIAGFQVSSESLKPIIASEEDFWKGVATTAMAAADIGTFGIVGNIKQLTEMIMETTQQLSKKLNKNIRRLKGRKITDGEVAELRAANLRSMNSWMFRADICIKIITEFRKITAKTAFSQMKKICELCQQIGYRPRGIMALFGIQIQSAGTNIRERWAVTSDKAGKLGWTASGLMKAVQVCEKLLSVRYGDVYVGYNRIIDSKDATAIGELNKAGLTLKQMNKAVTSITMATYHEIGKLVRMVNTLLTKIDPDYDEDDEY